jgi:hypothetical protein
MDDELDMLFNNYMEEENININDSTNRLIIQYIYTISFIYCNMMIYILNIWFITHHKKIIINKYLKF